MQELLDHHRIRTVMGRYARGVDRYDEELVLSVFHEDALDCHGINTVSPTGVVEKLMPALKEREASNHYLMNSVIDVDGDVAHVETYFILVRKLIGADDVELMGGRYVDRFERRRGSWKVAVRVVVADWQVSGDASKMSTIVAQFHSGSTDRDDPSYERPLAPRAALTAAV
jgi:hypothetical protein